MTFNGDWESFKSASGLFAAMNTSSPMVSTGSLYVFQGTFHSSQDVALNLCPVSGGSFAQGFLSGKYRQIMTPHGTFAGANTPKAGVVFMQSTRDLSSQGNAYVAAVRVQPNSGSVDRIALEKITGGLNSSGQATALATSAISVQAGSILALEVEWAASSGGTKLVLRAGSAQDFSDLATHISTEDTSSPLVSSETEGVFLFLPQGVDGGYLIDQTLLIST